MIYHAYSKLVVVAACASKIRFLSQTFLPSFVPSTIPVLENDVPRCVCLTMIMHFIVRAVRISGMNVLESTWCHQPLLAQDINIYIFLDVVLCESHMGFLHSSKLRHAGVSCCRTETSVFFIHLQPLRSRRLQLDTKTYGNKTFRKKLR
jgi:hypothetical protein